MGERTMRHCGSSALPTMCAPGIFAVCLEGTRPLPGGAAGAAFRKRKEKSGRGTTISTRSVNKVMFLIPQVTVGIANNRHNTLACCYHQHRPITVRCATTRRFTPALDFQRVCAAVRKDRACGEMHWKLGPYQVSSIHGEMEAALSANVRF